MADEAKRTPKSQAERRADEARERLEAAQAELAEAQGEVRAAVYRDVAPLVVRVLPNQHVVHEGKNYYGEGYPQIHGDSDSDNSEFEIDGPTAFALVMGGHVAIVRSADQ
jgi:hypothetical protein